MATVTVKYLSNYISKDNTAKVIILVLWSSAKREVNTGVKIAPEDWDEVNKQVRKRNKNYKDLNLLIEKKKSDIINIITEYRLRNEELTPYIFDSEINNPGRRSDFITFMEYEIHNRHKLKIINQDNEAHYKSILNKLKKFRSGILFADITTEFLNDFRKFLGKFNCDNTVYEALKTVRIFVKIAVERKLITKNPFIGYKMPKRTSNVLFITKDEFWKLYRMYESGYFKIRKGNDYQLTYHNTLQAFLFMCLTGLRISEFKSITMEKILTINNKKFLYIDTRKTDEKNLIPLSAKHLQIINAVAKNRVSGPVFEFPPDAKMNKLIKVICREAGIDRDKSAKITIHKARHTFATLLISEFKVDIPTVSALLGHKSTKTTLDTYSHLITSLKEDAMENLSKL